MQTMRSRFSIEWMAQSSQPAGSKTTDIPASGPAACGTHSESLPGFYWKQKSELLPEKRQTETKSQGLDGFSQSSPQPQSNNQVTETSLSSGAEEETSDYESEGRRSLSPPDPAGCPPSTSPASPQLGRRPRTAFTVEQISCLESAFKRNAYLGTQDKAELCKKLSLSDKQVRNWFQNRRMKMKRSVQDALAQACQANAASHFMHYSELQAYRTRTYPRYPSAAAAVVAPEGPAAAPGGPYAHPHSLQYSSPLTGVSALPLDSFYQYGSLPGVMLPSAPPHLRASYPPYPQYY